jgi:hypothetical protein
MNGAITLDELRTPPDALEVLRAEGIPDDAPVSERLRGLVDDAIERYASLVEPRGIRAEISADEFATIYRGEGNNEKRTPVEAIYPRAERLALFAVTLGGVLSEEITGLFTDNEPARAYMLDAIASTRADLAAQRLAAGYLADLQQAAEVDRSAEVLPYSPGYCGWHITGQRALFARLEPGRIGIELNESCLMQPLKSVSGVLIVGPGEIHRFDNDFAFCSECDTKECRARIASVTVPEE